MADDENNNRPLKRGRPPGKNRQAFTEEQKRARNAELERVRRGDIAAASSDLANEMRMETKVKLAHLLAATLTYVIREQEKEPVSELQATNDALEAEIKELERQQAIVSSKTEEEDPEEEEPPHSAEILDLEAATSSQPAKRARFSSEEDLLDQEAATSSQPAKRARLSSEQQSGSDEELLLVLAEIAQSSPETEPEPSPPHQPPATGAGEMDSLLSLEQLRALEALLDNMGPDDEVPSWPPDCFNFLLQP